MASVDKYLDYALKQEERAKKGIMPGYTPRPLPKYVPAPQNSSTAKPITPIFTPAERSANRMAGVKTELKPYTYKKNLGDHLNDWFVKPGNIFEEAWEFLTKKDDPYETIEKLRYTPGDYIDIAEKQLDTPIEKADINSYPSVKNGMKLVDEIGTAEQKARIKPKYEDRKKTFAMSPLKGTGTNIWAAVSDMAAAPMSLLNSVGADNVPVLKDITNGVIDGAKKAQEKAAVYNRGQYGQLAGGVTQLFTQMIPYVIMSIYTGGGGTATKLADPNVSHVLTGAKKVLENKTFWYSAAQGWGHKYQEAVDNGADRGAALQNAMYAFPEAMVEITGGFGGNNALKESFSKTIVNETMEELAQDIIGNTGAKMTHDKDMPVFSTTERAIINPVDMANTALMTAIGAGGAKAGMNVGMNVAGKIQNSNINPLPIIKEKIKSVSPFKPAENKVENLGIVNQDLLDTTGAVKKASRKFYQNFISGQAPLERAAKVQNKADTTTANLNDVTQQVRNVGGTVDYIIRDNMVDKNGNVIDRSWHDVVKQIPKEKGKLFNEYMLHRHNIERVANKKPVLQATEADSLNISESILAKNPEFKQIENDIHNYWDNFVQTWAVDGNLMTPEMYSKLKEKYPNYVPTLREDFNHPQSHIASGHRIGTKSPIQYAVGDVKEVVPVQNSFASYINKLVRSERKNELFLNLVDFVRTNPQEAAKYATLKDSNIMDEVDPETVMTDIERVDEDSLRQIRNGEYELTAYENGKPVKLNISREVFDALSNLIRPNIGPIQQLGRKVSSVPKSLITGKNPFFGLTNAFKDLQSSYANSITNNPVTFTQNLAKAMHGMATKSERYKQYVALGGNRSGFFNADKGYIKSAQGKGVVRDTITKGTDKLLFFNEMSEQAPRFAEYCAYLDKYGDTPANRKKAMLASADVTTNFARSAPITKTLDSWTMYLNAGVQGLDKVARQLKNRPVSTITKAAASGLAMSTIVGKLVPMLLGMAGNDDNPYYKDLDNRTKDLYYLIPNKSNIDENGNAKTFIKLPKSREYGLLLIATFERFARAANGEPMDEAFKDLGVNIINNISPANPITDNLFAPALAVLPDGNNKDFAGRTIVPESMKNLDPDLQYDSTTSGISKALGKKLNVSPMKTDYLLKSYTGVIGEMLLPATTGKPDGVGGIAKNAFINPLTRKFTADPLYQSGTVSKFYDDMKEAERTAKSNTEREGTPKEYVTPDDKRVRYYSSVGKEIAELRKQEKDLLGSMPNNDERKMKIDNIRKKISELAKNANANAEKVVADYKKVYVPEISMLSDELQAKARDMHNKHGLPYSKFNEMRSTLALPTVNGKVSGKEGSKKFTSMLPTAQQKFVSSTKEKESASDLQRILLLNRNDLTPEQKSAIDKTLIGELKNPVDYKSEDAFYFSKMSESKRNRYNDVKSRWNIGGKEYYTIVDACKGLKNQKQIVAKLQTLGFSGSASYRFYHVVFAPKRKGK